MPKLTFRGITFGCDPEFFFSKEGHIIGAEKVLPLDGLVYKAGDLLDNPEDGGTTVVGDRPSKVIIDGVQAELNPRANTCRANLGNEIACCFKRLQLHMKEMSGITIDFQQTIKLSDEDMELLSDRSKEFGCMPSKNAHNGGKEGTISVDPSIYQYRSAGGHIHIGAHTSHYVKEIMEVLAQPERLVKMFDLIVGNTCVLVDRDPGNRERRKVYGRAGEFRTPPHGVEYRTPSNFWLRNYQLMSMVTGLVRLAVNIVADNRDEELLKLVKMSDVQTAINENDFRLALSNFKKIQNALMDMIPEDDSEHFDINKNNVQLFRYFVKKGLDYWFKESPIEHWCSFVDGHNTGFGSFLNTIVKEDYKKHG